MAEEIKIGAKIKIVNLPPYLKTADPMPMLRPQDLIEIGEIGEIFDRTPGNYWVVKFKAGKFLIESQYFEIISTDKE